MQRSVQHSCGVKGSDDGTSERSVCVVVGSLRTVALAVLGLLAYPLPVAIAQDAEVGPSDAVAGSPAESEEAQWRWKRLSPFTLGRLADIAVSSADGLFAVTREGACWGSRQGKSWDEELRAYGAGSVALSSDEDVLLGIEVRVEELLDEFGDTPFDGLEGRPDDVASEEAAEQALDVVSTPLLAAAAEAGDQVQTELVNDPWFLDGAGGQSSTFLLRPRLLIEDGVWLARSDGLWTRRELRWQRVLEQPATSLAAVDGRWFVSTVGGGLLVSDNGEQWRPGVGPPVEHIFELVSTSQGLLAATDDGLWRSRDGVTFVRLGPLVEPVVRVREDGERLWVVTPQTVWRSDDGGQTLLTTSGDRLDGVQDLLPWQGGALATTGRGVYRTQDGGETWEPLAQGLGAVAARGLAQTPQGPVVATDLGVFQLVKAPPTVPQGLSSFVPLGHLVDAAGRRIEFNQRVGRRLAASFVPSVVLEGSVQEGDRLLYQPALGTDRFVDANVQARVQLVWTPQGRRTFDSDDMVMSGDVADLAPAVLISGGGAVAVLDESALRVGGSTLGRDSVEYRAELSEELGALYRARARLVADGSTSEELRSKVLRELERLELEALMDALSGGAVGRWQAGRQASGIEE